MVIRLLQPSEKAGIGHPAHCGHLIGGGHVHVPFFRQHHSHGAGQRGGFDCAQVLPFDIHRAFHRGQHPGECAQYGGLPRPVGTDQTDGLSPQGLDLHAADDGFSLITHVQQGGTEYFAHSFSFLVSRNTTTGAPITAVIAPNGSSAGDTMVRAAKSQSPAISAPPSIAAGRRMRLSDVWKSIRQIWGTARPIKDTGPAKAVTAALRTLETRIIAQRTALTFTPMLAA